MQIRRATSFEEVTSQRAAWNCLSHGIPFRSWEWNQSWWNHYGEGRELLLLMVFDQRNQLIGVAPWFAEISTMRGRCIKFLGTGEVCSDYLGVLTTGEHEDVVASALSDWLINANDESSEESTRWDLLELSSVARTDCTIAKLVEPLVEAGNMVYRSEDSNCWRLTLPESWDNYEAMLSKSHRKQVRRIDRRLLESGDAVLKSASNEEELAHGLQILMELHQKRRETLQQPGCFASPRFTSFFNEMAWAMFGAERLQLHWIELQGRPIACEFHLLGNGTTYAYQAGVDPESLDHEPGRLINIATIKRAIADKYQSFDFLRGDEPYKAHWRAEPQPQIDLRIVARRGLSQVRAGVWLAGNTVKSWLKTSLTLTGMR